MNEKVLKTMEKSVKGKAEEIRAAQKAYFMAKALEETIEAEAKEIQRKILESENYLAIKDQWEDPKRRIINPADTFLMSDDNFTDYLKKCYAEYLKAGIADKRGYEYCPEADARNARIEAEKILLELAIEIFPDIPEKKTLEEMSRHWKYREKMLDLILRLDV